jgi:hypothetical protein
MFDVGHTDPLSMRVDRTPTGVMRVRAARIRTARKKGPQTRPLEVAPASERAAPEEIVYARQPRPRPGP